MIYLSYLLNEDTPTYGNRNSFSIEKKSSISDGAIANDSYIETTVHIGTHIDMPYHFYDDGQTIEDYDAGFWSFKDVLVVEIEPKGLIIKDLLIERLESIDDVGYEILIVKTGICKRRGTQGFWEKNYGFHPDVYDYLISKFRQLRVLGFDSISVSSIQDRLLGRESHRRFLNPKHPILLLEDMDLTQVSEALSFREVIIAPLRIAHCDGLPCTVFGVVDD